MKPKVYIEKYHLNENPYFDRDAFVADIMDDFRALLQAVRLTTVTFENCVTALNVKWNNIFNGSKIVKPSADKFWGYFYATQIIPLRKFYFPDWKKAVHEHRYKTDRDYAM